MLALSRKTNYWLVQPLLWFTLSRLLPRQTLLVTCTTHHLAYDVYHTAETGWFRFLIAVLSMNSVPYHCTDRYRS